MALFIYLSSALDGVGGQRQSPAALSPGKRSCIHFTRGWVDPKTCTGRVRKILSPPGFDFPDPPARNVVAIQTKLSGFLLKKVFGLF